MDAILTALTKLDLYGNRLKTLPDTFGNLTAVIVLVFYKNPGNLQEQYEEMQRRRQEKT